MYKKIIFFLGLFLLTEILYAKEPTMAILVDVKSNDIQHFKIGNNKFKCSPYGVLSVDELKRESTFNSTCRDSIKRFYKKRPDLKYYTNSKLNIMQMYSIEIKKNRCIINISGGKSLSEYLLEEGIAVRKPFLKDKEFEYYLYKSQLKAKLLKKGIWKENITRECIANIYKKN